MVPETFNPGVALRRPQAPSSCQENVVPTVFANGEHPKLIGLPAQIAVRRNDWGHLGAISKNQKARVRVIRAFSCLNIGDPPRGRTENLLIKSQVVFGGGRLNLVFFSWLSLILPAKRYE